jgi:hypothetical protein
MEKVISVAIEDSMPRKVWRERIKGQFAMADSIVDNARWIRDPQRAAASFVDNKLKAPPGKECHVFTSGKPLQLRTQRFL